MAEVVVAQRMWQRRGTSAEWTTANPIPNAGEIGVVIETNGTVSRFKIGDGIKPWVDLPYFAGNGTVQMRSTSTQIQYSNDGGTTWANVISVAAITGPRGYSAYEVAVQQGYGGTAAQWVASLKGDPGPQGIPGPPGIPSQRRIQIVAATPTGAVTCNWAAYDEIQVTLTANVVFTFVGALPGQGCILKLRQDATGGRTITLPASVRYNRLIVSFANSVGATEGDIIGFKYDDTDVRYDFVSVVPGI